MGMIARITAFFRSEENGISVPRIKCSSQFRVDITTPHCTPPGDDSPPINTDQAALSESTGHGRFNAVGYVDTVNAGIALPGEKRFVGRDSNGVILSQFHMKADGSILVGNDNGTIELAANGVINMNGVIIDQTGNVTLPSGKTLTADNGSFTSSLLAAAKQLVGHLHLAGTPPGNTGPNV